MGIAASMFMIAAGAIMRFAVTAEGNGFNVHTTGMVLMVVGAIQRRLVGRVLGELGRVRAAHDRRSSLADRRRRQLHHRA